MYVDYVRAYQKSEGYAESVDRTASDNAKTDWDDYEGVNQIADINPASLDANGFGEDKTADAEKWYLSYNANNTGGNATLDSFKDENGKNWAKVGISEAGSQDYSVQLIGHYNAKAGYVYKVSFDAYADGNMLGKSVSTDSKEWAGAQAFSSFDTYLAPFVKVDNLSYPEVKKCIEAFIYGVNTPSRWGTQAPFSNITLDWTVPDDLAELPAVLTVYQKR